MNTTDILELTPAQQLSGPDGLPPPEPTTAWGRFTRAIEPWWDYGTSDIARLDTHSRDFDDESCGEAYAFQIQWLGFHFEITVGRTPPRVTRDEAIRNRRARLAREAARAAEGEA